MVKLREDTLYVLSGGTCAHHGPPRGDIPQRCESPDNNHYIDSTVVDSLVSAAKAYLSSDLNESNEKIRINDISLPLGGGFDINGNWGEDTEEPQCEESGHCSHRIGKDVDIENVTNKNSLKRIFEKRDWDFVNESGNAFPHFRY